MVQVYGQMTKSGCLGYGEVGSSVWISVAGFQKMLKIGGTWLAYE